jgi:cell division protein FtsB
VVNTTSKALTVALFVLLVSMQYQLWRGPSGLCQLFEIKRQMAKRNAVLAADVADLREGDEAIEEHARTVLGMIKNNETFYQVIE